ncbi:hypothetical protein EON64_10960, partial [archaeon]
MNTIVSLYIEAEGGQTLWALQGSHDKLPNIELAQDSSNPEKGLGVVARSPIAQSSIAFHNDAVSSVLMNWRSAELCFHCYQVIDDAVRVSDKCRHLKFCSDACLSASQDYIAQCGQAINKLASLEDSTYPSENYMLALDLLYRIGARCSAKELCELLRIFTLKSDSVSSAADDEAADTFFGVLASCTPRLLEQVRWCVCFDSMRCCQLLRTIRLNTQPAHLLVP